MKYDRVFLRDLIGAVVLALIMLLIGPLLGGCATTYDAQRIETGGVTTTLHVRTYREFPGGVDIHYDREAGQFDVQAGEVANGDDAMAEVILRLLPLIDPQPGG